MRNEARVAISRDSFQARYVIFSFLRDPPAIRRYKEVKIVKFARYCTSTDESYRELISADCRTEV